MIVDYSESLIALDKLKKNLESALNHGREYEAPQILNSMEAELEKLRDWLWQKKCQSVSVAEVREVLKGE